MTQETQVDFPQEQEVTYSRSQHAQVQPQKKKSKGKRIVGLIFLLIVLLAGGGAAYRYFSSDINGTYHAKALEDQIKSGAEVEQTEDGIDYKDVITDVKVDLKVENEQVTGTVSYKVDSEEAYNIYEQSVNKELEGSDAEMSQQVKDLIPSKEDIVENFNQLVDTQSKALGLKFDKETGEVSGTFLKGKVNRWTHRIEITSQNKNLFAASNANSGLKDFISGNSISYSKSGNGVLLGDDGDSVTFEKE